MKQDIRRLIISKGIVDKAITHFEESLPGESVVFIFGRASGNTLLATDILIPSEEDYVRRSPAYCEVSYKFLAKNIHPFWDEGKDLVLSWHCHPIEGLSHTDIGNHENLIKVFPNHLSGFYNRGSYDFYRENGDGIGTVPFKIVDTDKFDRQLKLFGEGQMLLASTTVALIGCGGGNSEVARMLAQKGIGELILIDPDKWDETNLNRVWIPSSFVGRNKAESMAGLLKDYRPETDVQAYPLDVRDIPTEALKDADFLVTFTDTLASRLYVNEIAVKLNKPSIFAASEIRVDKQNNIEWMVGDCLVYIPGKTPCYRCNLSIDYEKLRREIDDPAAWKQYAQRYGLPLELAPRPSVVELNTVIAGILTDELTKLVTGYAEPIHHQYFDFYGRRMMVFSAEINPECPACMEVPEVRLESGDVITEEEALNIR